MSKLLAVLVAIFAAAWFTTPAFADGPRDPAGYIKICKDAGTSAVSGVFSFQISGTVERYDTQEVWVGQCTSPIRVTPTSDSKVLVTEVGYTDASHFNTNDFTVVSAFHSTSYADPADAALISTSLTARTAWIKVTPSVLDDVSRVAILHVVNDPVYGYYEICKHQVTGAGLDNQIFSFQVTGALGYSQRLDVPVGSCSMPQYAPAGHVNVQELGDELYVTAITANDHNLIAYDLDDGEASVAVSPAAIGFTANDSIVTYTNNTSQLEICKVVPDDGSLDNSSAYTFNANGTSYTVNSAGLHVVPSLRAYWGGYFDADTVYGCVLAGRYRAGTSVTVTETPKPGQMVARDPSGKVVGIQLDPVWRNHDAVLGGNDFAGRSVTFKIDSGDTTVYFLNVPADPQPLKICKMGVSAGGSVQFTVAGPRTGLRGAITTGSTTVPVPVGSCSDPVNYPFAGPQLITEASGAYHLTGVTATTDALNGTRLGTVNLAAGSAVVWIGDGTTTAMFTNAAGAAAGGTTTNAVTTTQSTQQQPQQGLTTTPPAEATVVSTTPPTKVVAPAKVLKVASAKIVSVGKLRYVVVRVNGNTKMAHIHVTLIDKNHKVVGKVTRYVTTNKAVRVGNLTLKPSIVSVKVAL